MTFPNPQLLLHPQIPKPLHGLNPRTLLGKPWWDRERKRAYRKHQWHCHACGIKNTKAVYHQWLEGHETYKINYDKGVALYLETVALCHCCHSYIHAGRLNILFTQKKIAIAKYKYIINHGSRILRAAFLTPTAQPNDVYKKVKFSSWRLQIGRSVFMSPFKNEAEWEKYYNRQ